jgi:hypothetical protein
MPQIRFTRSQAALWEHCGPLWSANYSHVAVPPHSIHHPHHFPQGFMNHKSPTRCITSFTLWVLIGCHLTDQELLHNGFERLFRDPNGSLRYNITLRDALRILQLSVTDLKGADELVPGMDVAVRLHFRSVGSGMNGKKKKLILIKNRKPGRKNPIDEMDLGEVVVFLH